MSPNEVTKTKTNIDYLYDYTIKLIKCTILGQYKIILNARMHGPSKTIPPVVNKRFCVWLFVHQFGALPNGLKIVKIYTSEKYKTN